MRPQFRGCAEPALPYHAALILINGFRQGAGPNEGLWRLYQDCCRRWFDRRRDLVLYRTWDSNHAETAGLVAACQPQYVALCGYSYGCGWGCTELARELADHSHTIDDIFLIDPVPRYRLVPAKIKSLTRGGHYRVPVNVSRVHAWRQVNKRGPFDPVGHAVEMGTTATRVVLDKVLGTRVNLQKHGRRTNWPPSPCIQTEFVEDYTVNHSNIDDHQKIHEHVVAVAAMHSTPPEPQPCTD